MDAKTVGKYKTDIVLNGVDFQDQHFLNTYYGLNINVFWKLKIILRLRLGTLRNA